MYNYKQELVIENNNEKYQEEFNMFYENARKFITYLEEEKIFSSYNINKYKKRYRKTKLALTEKSLVTISNEEDEITINLDGVRAVTLNVRLEHMIQPQVCIVKTKRISKKLQRQVMFHELMHIASKRFNRKKYEMEVFCGISIVKNNKRKYVLINEALTEIVAKKIFDKIYDEKYNLFELEEKPYLNATLTMYNFINDLPDKEVFDIYFNNKVDKLEQIVKNKARIDLDTLDSLFEKNKYNYVIDLIENGITMDEVMKKYY